jgi:NAD(P)-dependent dehydrogenase (short-subunit alcohol dehydrogenase family)
MTAWTMNDLEILASMIDGVPLGRIGTPEDMAGTAIFLASRAGAYLTGAIIPVDSGVSGTR